MNFKDVLSKGLDEKKMLIEACVRTMEKYLLCFSQDGSVVSISGEDAERWKKEFLPGLIQAGEDLFGDIPGPDGMGGWNGTFSGHDYFRLMYRLYRKLYELSVVK